MVKKNVSLAISRGEKLPVSRGAGLTAKGRAKYNRETGSDLKAQPKIPAAAGTSRSVLEAVVGKVNAAEPHVNDGGVDESKRTVLQH